MTYHTFELKIKEIVKIIIFSIIHSFPFLSTRKIKKKKYQICYLKTRNNEIYFDISFFLFIITKN